MARLVLALIGIVLLAVTALALVWLLGQVLVGLGAFVVGASAVLARLLVFVLVAGGLAGLTYFVASAWRPARPASASALAQPSALAAVTGAPVTTSEPSPAAASASAPEPADSAAASRPTEGEKGQG